MSRHEQAEISHRPKWHARRFWRVRWLLSPAYRHRRRLALEVAELLANDPEHVAKVNALAERQAATPKENPHE